MPELDGYAATGALSDAGYEGPIAAVNTSEPGEILRADLEEPQRRS